MTTVIQGAKKRVGFITGEVAMFSAHEHLITCPHGVLRVVGGGGGQVPKNTTISINLIVL